MAHVDDESGFIGEASTELATEVCNGMDDDGNVQIDEGNVCMCQEQVNDNHEYLLCDTQLNWYTARAACRGQGFDLVRIEDEVENKWLATFPMGQGRWIDLSDRAAEGDWRWGDGTVPYFLNWSKYEPNNHNNEDCGMMWTGGMWNDLHCSWNNLTICELQHPVTWELATNVSIFGTKLTKNISAGYGWNASASSVQRIESGNGFVQFTTFEPDTVKAAGLGHGHASSYDQIEFAIYFASNGTVRIYENGSYKGIFGAYAKDDVFRVEVLDGKVRYLRNGSLLYTHAVAPVYPLVLNAALYTPGATIGRARIRSCAAGDMSCMDSAGQDFFDPFDGNDWSPWQPSGNQQQVSWERTGSAAQGAIGGANSSDAYQLIPPMGTRTDFTVETMIRGNWPYPNPYFNRAGGIVFGQADGTRLGKLYLSGADNAPGQSYSTKMLLDYCDGANCNTAQSADDITDFWVDASNTDYHNLKVTVTRTISEPCSPAFPCSRIQGYWSDEAAPRVDLYTTPGVVVTEGRTGIFLAGTNWGNIQWDSFYLHR